MFGVFLLVGLIWLFASLYMIDIYGMKGPDYSHEVEGKVLDLWDSKWKTPEQFAQDQKDRGYLGY
jgi:hypothetical protein